MLCLYEWLINVLMVSILFEVFLKVKMKSENFTIGRVCNNKYKG
jgi:hypothetical protein